MRDVTLNQNYAECIKSVSNWGETIYTNICLNTSHTLVWGSMDYLSMVMLVLFGGSFALMMLGLAITALLD